MNQVDKQALRESAVNAKLAGEAPVMPFDQRIDALNSFTKLLTPSTAIALLDELEAKDRRNAELNSTLERWAVDRAQSASNLEAAEKRVAELEAEPVAMSDHRFRELVNTLRDIAIEYHGTQQLREHIARACRAAMPVSAPQQEHDHG
ncbi:MULTISPECIES: ead/Ea22-like family protein [Edwardsiella]|uniref:Ead/Ea22-like family protein n=1 Tax=Edwardsiella anguillarum TaxID=1821960 RepID=A0ABY8SGG3_9GAMM|nr:MULTISPECIES: ead/Ea22-like family protein [Edwardsiella]UBU94859.1 ead/Ea22-like family protein [Edwardsiella sp. LADL05-105]WHP84625.1 ead/Ea22-like family protein [Edwardsiella anguillarum]WHP88408.1 ead/Ea22-like family protein [Edwardsiella anguillarum]WHP92208.1 ead/Ea22-like family protein [Edwardsiella anguillarum]WHP96014.1 ead/Ea22-like family protein [Edwardsiella anguillarum]